MARSHLAFHSAGAALTLQCVRSSTYSTIVSTMHAYLVKYRRPGGGDSLSGRNPVVLGSRSVDRSIPSLRAGRTDSIIYTRYTACR